MALGVVLYGMPQTGIQQDGFSLTSGDGEVAFPLTVKGKNHLAVHLRADKGVNVTLDVRNSETNDWITGVETWSGRTDLDYTADTAANEIRLRLEAPGPDVTLDLMAAASG